MVPWMRATLRFGLVVMTTTLTVLLLLSRASQILTDVQLPAQVDLTPFMLLALGACWLLSLLFHEVGHLLAARLLGLDARLVVIWHLVFPSLAVQVYSYPQWTRPKRIAVAAAGPLADLVLLFSSGTILTSLSCGALVFACRLSSFVVVLSICRFVSHLMISLRTDLYYLIEAALGVPELASTSRLWWKMALLRLVGKRWGPPNGLSPHKTKVCIIYGSLAFLTNSMAALCAVWLLARTNL